MIRILVIMRREYSRRFEPGLGIQYAHGSTQSLVHRVRRDAQFPGNFLGIEMRQHQPQAIALPVIQPVHCLNTHMRRSSSNRKFKNWMK
jgi:hypothetical protein